MWPPTPIISGRLFAQTQKAICQTPLLQGCLILDTSLTRNFMIPCLSNIKNIFHHASLLCMQCADAGPQASPAPPWPSEIHMLLPWQQVPQREFPFCDKEWLSRARKKPKSYQGHVIKDPHGRLRVWDQPATAVEVFLNKCEYIQHTLSPPSSLPAETSQARTRTERPPPPVLSESESEHSRHHGVRFWKTQEDRIL